MILRMSWYYLMGKMSELLDTVFFVLRKKHNQVTFLHVYHHSLMFILSWMFIKYFGTDSATFIGSINSFVHVIMYGYYGLAALGPQVAKYLTWKKHITALQLTQFVLIFLHFGISDYLSDCPASRVYIYILVPNVTLFLYLFSRFYVKTYNEKENNKKQKVSLESDNNAHAKGQNGFAKEVRRQRSTTKDFKGM